MGSRTFEGIWFAVFSQDHLPPHVHGRYGEVQVIVDLLASGVRLSSRVSAVVPSNAKRSHVRHILEIAVDHRAELMELWEKTHGTAF